MANITTLDLGPVRQVYKGEYSPAVPYDLLNTVFYQGESWVMIKTPYIAGSTPAIDSPYWQKIAVKGLNGKDGEKGAKGDKGDKGDPGEGASVDVSTLIPKTGDRGVLGGYSKLATCFFDEYGEITATNGGDIGQEKISRAPAINDWTYNVSGNTPDTIQVGFIYSVAGDGTLNFLSVPPDETYTKVIILQDHATTTGGTSSVSILGATWVSDQAAPEFKKGMILVANAINGSVRLSVFHNSEA